MRRRSTRDERGHLMAGLLVAIAIMLIFSTVVFQSWEDVKRRDDEAEMMFRAKEIVRAIRRYKGDYNGLGPASLDDLLKPGPQGQYYLRHPYPDPLTKEGAWGLLYDGPGGIILDPSGADIGDARQIRKSERPSIVGLEGQEIDLSGANTGSFGETDETTMVGGKHGARQLGALRIAGVRSLCTDKPFRVFRGFADYHQWTFTFQDIDIGGTAVRPLGQPAQTPGQTPGGRPRPSRRRGR